jgi:hypothetical protein
MSDETTTGADEIREEIDRTRADLAQTVDALHDKLDVKARAKTKAHDVSASVSTTATKLMQQAPPPVQAALDRSASAIAPAAAKAQPYRSQIALGAGGAVVVLLIIRRIRRSR